MTIHPQDDIHYLNLLNQLMAIQLSNGFSHLQPEVFHISLRTHKIQCTQPRGWKKKKNKQARTWVSSKRKKEEVCDTFVWFSCASVGYRERIFKQNSHTATRNADSSSRPLGPQILAVASLWLLLIAPSCRQPSSVHYPGTLPSLVFFWSHGKSHVQALWVGFVPKQTKKFF